MKGLFYKSGISWKRMHCPRKQCCYQTMWPHPSTVFRWSYHCKDFTLYHSHDTVNGLRRDCVNKTTLLGWLSQYSSRKMAILRHFGKNRLYHIIHLVCLWHGLHWNQ
jgi:hypothetical protein